MSEHQSRLKTLEDRVSKDLQTLAYPDGNWVEPRVHPSGQHVYDVVVVGAGQSGLACGFHLKRDGASNILLLDRNREGYEGVWETFARMETLRTPKTLVGVENGVASLSVREWYEARYGVERWNSIDRIGRTDWMAYLRWLRTMFQLPIRNERELEGIEPDGDIFALRLRGPGGSETVLTRYVVLATGYDGGGEWRIPAHIVEAVPKERRFHSNGPIDFTRMAGGRVGILGHGASAFDTAVTALRQGVRSVDLCFRRPAIPKVNPHRWIEFGGFLKHFPDLDDRVKWNVNRFFKKVDQPPAHLSYLRANEDERFAMHPATSWNDIRFVDDAIKVRANGREHVFDYIVCATGSVIDLAHRPELRPFVGDIALWRDRFVPSEMENHEGLGAFPYLDRHYAFQQKHPGAAPHLERIYAFNFSAIVSMGPHSTSVSGHKYSVPRLTYGLTRKLMLDQTDWLMRALEEYDECDLPALPERRNAFAALTE